MFHSKIGVSPRSQQIDQDVDKAIYALSTIHGAKGVFVQGLAGGRVPGQHHTKTTEKMSNNYFGAIEKSFFTLTRNKMHYNLNSLLDDMDWDATWRFAQKYLFDQYHLIL